MRPHHQTATGERGQVGPHGDLGDAEEILELGHEGVAAFVDQAQDALATMG